MTFRPFQESDTAALAHLAGLSSFPYVDPNSQMVEACMVAVDEDGKVVAAIAAERIVQLFFWRSPNLSPAAIMGAFRGMEKNMATELKKKGYNSCEAFIPPQLEKKFGKRLERTLGFVKNWNSWARTL